MKGHSVYVEERTVWVCTCKAEFESMKEAEAHLRNPPAEKNRAPKPVRPKKRAPAPRRVSVRTVPEPEVQAPEIGGESWSGNDPQ